MALYFSYFCALQWRGTIIYLEEWEIGKHQFISQTQTYITHMGTKTSMFQAYMQLLNCWMLFVDTFIQIIYIAFKVHVLSVYAFLGNQTHNLKTVNAPLFELQELPEKQFLKLALYCTVCTIYTTAYTMHNFI